MNPFRRADSGSKNDVEMYHAPSQSNNSSTVLPPSHQSSSRPTTSSAMSSNPSTLHQSYPASSRSSHYSSSSVRRPQSSSYNSSAQPQGQSEVSLGGGGGGGDRSGLEPQSPQEAHPSHYQHFPPLQNSHMVPPSLQPHGPPIDQTSSALPPTITFQPSSNSVNGASARSQSQAYSTKNLNATPSTSLQPGAHPGASSSPVRPGLPGINTQYRSIQESPVSDLNKYMSYSGHPNESNNSTPVTSHRPAIGSQYANKFLASGNLGFQSPLVLDQIRPRANSTRDDDSSMSEAIPGSSNYLAPWPVFAYDWCKWSMPTPVAGSAYESAGKMAIGSYLENPHNYIQILDTSIIPGDLSSGGIPTLEFTKTAEATCSYPVTRILWEPPSSSKQSDLLATSGDHLRLWSLPNVTTPQNHSNTITRSSAVNQKSPSPNKLTPLALLSNSKTPEHTAPLTSLDWNQMSPKLIITSSIDTTCTIWDIPTLTAKTQLIAHDKEVFDVRFCAHSVDVFVSCGADGSVRMFDLRSLEHSTIIYEPNERLEAASPGAGLSSPRPLLRVAASPHDTHVLATFAADSNVVRILDVRQPGQALLELQGHKSSIGAIEWNPNRRGVLASAGDDCLVMTWDLLSEFGATVDVPSYEGWGDNNGNTSSSASGGSTNDKGSISFGGHNSSYGMSGPGSALAPGLDGPTSGAGSGGVGNSGPSSGSGPGSGAGSSGGAGTGNQSIAVKGPTAYWRCDYEPTNLSWSPQYKHSSAGNEWLGVVGGKGVWSVKMG